MRRANDHEQVCSPKKNSIWARGWGRGDIRRRKTKLASAWIVLSYVVTGFLLCLLPVLAKEKRHCATQRYQPVICQVRTINKSPKNQTKFVCYAQNSFLGLARKRSRSWRQLFKVKMRQVWTKKVNVFRHFIKDSWKEKAVETQGMKKSDTISKSVLFPTRG